MLNHQAASAVGGERIRLKELCLKMVRARLGKKTRVMFARSCPDFSSNKAED